MRPYLISLGVGLLVGVLYSLLNVRSPAPPLVALGLLDILIGEQIIPVGKHMLAGSPLVGVCREAGCVAHLFGMLPGRHQGNAATTEHVVEKRP
jgi:XapX domain-containing protein